MKKDEGMFDKEYQKEREDLAGENKLGDMGQLILFFVFLVTWIMDTFFLRYSVVATSQIIMFIRIPIAIVILCAAGYLAKTGLEIVFGQVRDKPRVIREGVFSLVRHPIYLGAILLYLGLLVFSFSIISVIIWMIIIAFYYYISKYEEKLLIQKYGNNYEEYVKEVPMLIPRLKRE
jgi:protein-S-isoprenylcysteine O-methyltransferase Ste14